jgi:hypothetical protein
MAPLKLPLALLVISTYRNTTAIRKQMLQIMTVLENVRMVVFCLIKIGYEKIRIPVDVQPSKSASPPYCCTILSSR